MRCGTRTRGRWGYLGLGWDVAAGTGIDPLSSLEGGTGGVGEGNGREAVPGAYGRSSGRCW